MDLATRTLDQWIGSVIPGTSKKKQNTNLFLNRKPWIATEELSDSELCQYIQQGHSDLFDELVRRYSHILFSTILRMTNNDSTARDIHQDTWVLIVRKIGQYQTSRPLKPWLIRIAVNCCRDHWRKEKIRRYIPWSTGPGTGGIPEPADPADPFTDDKQMDITKGLREISPKLREVVVLKFYSGMTHDEIAHSLNIPSGTVKSRLHLALKKLRTQLKVMA